MHGEMATRAPPHPQNGLWSSGSTVLFSILCLMVWSAGKLLTLKYELVVYAHTLRVQCQCFNTFMTLRVLAEGAEVGQT